MATKTPIVGTNLAIEGIEIKDGQEAFVADSAEKLAQKTIEVLNNPITGKKLADLAYSLVSKKYNWKIISAKLKWAGTYCHKIIS